jgi:hypothetical protein
MNKQFGVKIRNATSSVSFLDLGIVMDPESSGITVSYFVKISRAFSGVSRLIGLFSPSVALVWCCRNENTSAQDDGVYFDED